MIIDNLEKRILKVAQDVLGSKVIFFEHGQLGEVAGNSSCISHAHIHAFPNNSIKVDDINGFENVTFSFSKDGFQNEEGQYFAMKDVEGVYTFAFDHELPSQFFRRFLAQKLKQQFWNWQDYVQFSSLLGTAKKIELGQSFFKELHRSLVKNNDIN